MKKLLILNKKLNQINYDLNVLIRDLHFKNIKMLDLDPVFRGSVGCDKYDYSMLYQNIKKFKFKEIFEAGLGISTIVIAYSLYENHKESNIKGMVTSMESSDKYLNIFLKLIPDFLKPYIEIVYTSVINDYYGIFRGIRYKDIPNRPYDFCWIDGPSNDKVDLTSNFDLIHILKSLEGSLYALIDGRYPTIYMLQQIFGRDKVYRAQKKKCYQLGVVNSVNKEELETFNNIKSYSRLLR